jgi:hypothetical protein
MRYADMRGLANDRTKTGKLRKRSQQLLSQAGQQQPPASPPRVNTGERGDWQGNVYLIHSQGYQSLREMRRTKRFGRLNIQPMRSRIQRAYRRQRTGGVK